MTIPMWARDVAESKRETRAVVEAAEAAAAAAAAAAAEAEAAEAEAAEAEAAEAEAAEAEAKRLLSSVRSLLRETGEAML
jgi:hypothetical protein